MQNDKLFKDLKLVEFASVLAGPLAGSFFAELGARVIKVENSLQGGDVTRQWKLPGEDPANTISAYYASANFGKECIMANLSDASEREAVLREIMDCDIVISNFKPGSAEKLGLAYENLREINPRLIYAALTGYGRDKPKPAYDLVVQAETGYLSMTGEKSGGPCKIPVAMIDIMAAHHLKEAILCALIKRERTGEGSFITLSLVDAAIASLVNQASNYLMTGKVAGRMGSRHPNIAPYGDSYSCSDGKDILLAIGSDRQFAEFCEIAGLDSYGFETNTKRLEKRDALNGLIGEQISKQTVDYWERVLTESDIPHARISDMADVFAQDRHKERILFSEIEGTLTARPKTAYI